MDPGFKEAVTSKLPQRPKSFKVPEPMDISWYHRMESPQEKTFVAINKDAKGVAELTTALTSDMEIQSLEFAQLVPVLLLSDWMNLRRHFQL